MDVLAAIMMWGFLAMLAIMPVAMLWGYVDERRKRARGEASLSSGSLLGFDDIWRPTAAEARAIWTAEQTMPAPAPIPSDGPGVIEGNRIVIETGLRHRR
ncbi:hypothetical protein [Microbacterium sp.]|uniref:hypothetical protein n=1 Tax=Microbacterium sp. TaxID=51671 RepID=UPI003221F11D